MKDILKVLFMTLFTILCLCSFVFSIGFLANVAKIWWQVCLGWCWLVVSISPVIFGLNCLLDGLDFMGC